MQRGAWGPVLFLRMLPGSCRRQKPQLSNSPDTMRTPGAGHQAAECTGAPMSHARMQRPLRTCSHRRQQGMQLSASAQSRPETQLEESSVLGALNDVHIQLASQQTAKVAHLPQPQAAIVSARKQPLAAGVWRHAAHLRCAVVSSGNGGFGVRVQACDKL